MVDKLECRVLFVTGNLGLSGAETWIIALLKYFKEYESVLPVRVNVHIFLSNGFKSDLDDEAVSLGATLHYSKFSRKNVWGFISDWRGVLRKYKFHVIHDHQENTAGIHFLMGLGFLPPVRIAHLHNPLIHLKRYSCSSLRRATLYFGKLLISKLGTHILSTSRQLLGEQGYLNSKFEKLERRAIYCGFDPSRFVGNCNEQFKSLCEEFNFTEDSRIALFVGRLDSNEDDRLNQKNPAFALEVARRCAEIDPSFRMLMVGGGESVRERLEERVKSWGLADRILLVGQRIDVPRFMLGSRVFLLTSIAEGLGMVVVEAQASGLPSIVSDVTPKECAVDNDLVEFLSLNDGVDAWAARVLEMSSRPRMSNFVANCIVRDSGFSIEKSVGNLLEIYTENLSFGTHERL